MCRNSRHHVVWGATVTHVLAVAVTGTLRQYMLLPLHSNADAGRVGLLMLAAWHSLFCRPMIATKSRSCHCQVPCITQHRQLRAMTELRPNSRQRRPPLKQINSMHHRLSAAVELLRPAAQVTCEQLQHLHTQHAYPSHSNLSQIPDTALQHWLTVASYHPTGQQTQHACCEQSGLAAPVTQALAGCS
jgi:hypothetical protein